jgi:hypothetical protein
MQLIGIRAETDKRLRAIVRATPGAAICSVVDVALRLLEPRLASGEVARADLCEVRRRTYNDGSTAYERFKLKRELARAIKRRRKSA